MSRRRWFGKLLINKNNAFQKNPALSPWVSYEPEGREFESLQARHIINKLERYGNLATHVSRH